MTENFLVRTLGGPDPGDRIVGSDQFEWPLPGIIGGVDGAYVKVSESTAPPQEPGSMLIRSALYEWRTNKQMEEAKNAQAQAH